MVSTNGNVIWASRFAAAITDDSLSDDDRMKGIRDVAREMTQRPIYLELVGEDADVGMYADAASRGIVGHWGLVDHGCYSSRPYFLVSSNTCFKDATPEDILAIFEFRYRWYIQQMCRSGGDPEAYVHFDEVDMLLFRRLDELGISCEAPFWGDLEGWVNHANHFREALHRRASYHPTPTTSRSVLGPLIGMSLTFTMLFSVVVILCFLAASR